MDSLKGVFTILAEQHKLLDQKLNLAVDSLKEPELKGFLEALSAFREILIQHHDLEFDYLIRRAGAHPRCREGGPFCTYYIDVYGFLRPMEDAFKLMKQLDPQRSPPEVPSNYKSLFDMNSPVTIPLEEHIAIDYISREILLTDVQVLSGRRDWLQQAVQFLSKWLRLNSQKEEQCFFTLCQNILPPESKLDLPSGVSSRTGS